MLVLRTSKNVKGDLCKACIDRHFWEFTLITLVLGWWGMISCVLTPIFLANNIYRFCTTLGMSKAGGKAVDAAPSEHPTLSLTADARARLTPFRGELAERVATGAEIDDVAADIARKAKVSAVQAELFAREVA
jgi:hypothetical protein